MNPPDAFNFGRRIKDLKRTYNKTYADLTAGLKLSRERIIQLEENEREPTELEIRRFADFFGITPEELNQYDGPPPRPFGSPGGGERGPSYQPQPFDNRPNPGYGPPQGQGNYGPPQGQGQGNYGGPSYNQPQERRGGYEPRGGNYDGPGGGNYNDRPPRGPDRGGYNDRPPQRGPDRGGYNDRPPQRGPDRGGYNDRPPQRGPGGPGGFNDRPPQRGPGGPGIGGGRPQDEADRPPRPARPPKPKEPKPANSGEPKLVMKYTAEQLGDIESAYLRKQRDLKVSLKFTFLNGQEYTGVVSDFTPFTVHIIDQTTGEEVILRKLAMAYYRKADAIEEARMSQKPEEV